MVGIVGSDKCNAIAIASLKILAEIFLQNCYLWYALDLFYQVYGSFSSFNRFSLLFFTILTISFANDSDILFFVCSGWQLV